MIRARARAFLPFWRARGVWGLFCGVFFYLDGVNGLVLGSTALKTIGHYWYIASRFG